MNDHETVLLCLGIVIFCIGIGVPLFLIFLACRRAWVGREWRDG